MVQKSFLGVQSTIMALFCCCLILSDLASLKQVMLFCALDSDGVVSHRIELYGFF